MTNTDAPRIDAFLQFYNDLSSHNLAALERIYHPQVRFIDPVHQIEGVNALEQYFSHAYERLLQCEFIGQDKIEHGDKGCVSWTMRFSHNAIGNGKLIEVDGCTVVHWQDGLIIYHRDYYDLDQMVLQHLPVLGWLTAKVKQKMAN